MKTTKLQNNNLKIHKIKKIAIMTSGGDAPGMNMVVISLLRFLYKFHYQCAIVYEGIKGLITNQIFDFNFKNFIELTDHIYDSGTFIKSSRVTDFYKDEKQDIAIKNLKKNQVDLLIVIGGDGSYNAANALLKKGMNVICIPATIDNDVASTQYTIGFFSALNFIYEYIKAIRNTAKSFGSFCLIEVMGRECSDLCLNAAISSLADAVITKDNAWSIDDFVNNINLMKKNNKHFGLFIVTEKYYGLKNQLTYDEIITEVENKTNIHMKFDSIGYAQRGANPSSYEMLNAYKFAKVCVNYINDNHFNIALGWKNNMIIPYDLTKAIKMKKGNNLHEINGFNEFLFTLYKDNL